MADQLPYGASASYAGLHTDRAIALQFQPKFLFEPNNFCFKLSEITTFATPLGQRPRTI